MVGLLLWRADPQAVAHSIAEARPIPAILAFGLALLTLVLSALRWRSFLKPLGFHLSTGPLIRLYFVGVFFNAFLPTGIGGDAYKATRLRGGVGARPRSFASVLLDRIAGVAGLALLALAGALFLLGERRHGAVINTTVGLALAGLLGCGLLVAVGSARRRRGGTPTDAAGLRGWLSSLMTSISTTGLDDGAATVGLGYGIVTAGMIVGTHALLASALGISVPLPALAGIAFLSVVVVVLPLTINGLGAREATYVWALTAFGIGHSQALAFAFLVLAVLLASSAVGGVVYLLAGGEMGSRESGAADGPAGSSQPELGRDGIHEPNDHGLGVINGSPASRQDGVREPPDEDLAPPQQVHGGVPGSRQTLGSPLGSAEPLRETDAKAGAGAFRDPRVSEIATPAFRTQADETTEQGNELGAGPMEELR